MISTILLYSTIFLFFYAFYKWATANDDYFKKKGIPFKKPTFLIGNSANLLFRTKSAQANIIEHYNNFPNAKLSGVFDLTTRIYLIRDPELLKQIAVKDFESFLNHRVVVDDKMDPFFGNSLFFLKDQKWKDMRSTLSPAFTGSKMKQMFGLVSECGDELGKYFLKESKKGRQVLEMKDIFSRFTNDVIATSAFGIKVNSLEEQDNEFITLGRELVNLASPLTIVKFLGYVIIPWFMRFFEIALIRSKYTTFFKNLITGTMKTREEQGINRPDMINLLIQARKGTLVYKEESDKDGFATVAEHDMGKKIVKRDWSDNEMVAQCFLFFLAGFDTSSTLMSFLSYELALNPEIQKKLLEEIDETNQELDGKVLTYDALQKMKYMDMVISEGLRKWPPAPVVDRVCTKDYELKDESGLNIKIDKGINMWIPIHAFHRNPAFFPDPTKFDPERFSDENKGNIIPGTYIPFGVGPRNCIGSRFALMETKAVVYYILRNFTFEVCEKTDVPLTLKNQNFALAAEKGIWLELKPRQK